MLKHLYLAWWRDDILAGLTAKGSPVVAVCDFVGNGESVVADTRLVTCPACRETFLQALPTGDGTKLTWSEYVAREKAAPRVTLAQRAAQLDAAGWSTKPDPAPAPNVGGWTSNTGNGWSTK